MIRFAVIGTNTITDKFLQAASALPDFKLCAVYSRTLARAQEYAQKNNVSLVFDSLEALANSDQIDAVYIASPNFCHAAQSILMMQHHKHVLCEKPIASNASEFQQMYDTAIKNQVILLEAMRSVFSPGFAAIRSLLPVLGTIRQIDFSFCKYSSRYDHFKEGIIENAFHPALSNAGHRCLLCPSARLPVWHAGFDSEQQHFFIQRLRRRRHGSFTVPGYAGNAPVFQNLGFLSAVPDSGRSRNPVDR